jgi:uncharacterized integral membrane protein (TIGR02327 family)
MSSFGTTGLVNIVLSLLCIGISWWALQAIRIDLFVKQYDHPRTKVLLIFLSIIIGNGVARFFMDYLGWSLMLKQLLG